MSVTKLLCSVISRVNIILGDFLMHFAVDSMACLLMRLLRMLISFREHALQHSQQFFHNDVSLPRHTLPSWGYLLDDFCAGADSVDLCPFAARRMLGGMFRNVWNFHQQISAGILFTVWMLFLEVIIHGLLRFHEGNSRPNSIRLQSLFPGQKRRALPFCTFRYSFIFAGCSNFPLSFIARSLSLSLSFALSPNLSNCQRKRAAAEKDRSRLCHFSPWK